MIPTTSFAEKSDQAARFFVLNRSLRAASPRPSGTGDPFLFLRTGAEAPAYSQSASPRRGRFYSSAIHPASRVPVVSVLKALNTHSDLGRTVRSVTDPAVAGQPPAIFIASVNRFACPGLRQTGESR